MLIYVSHRFSGKPSNIEKAKKITHDLQIKDLANCYICPLTAFSHLGVGEIAHDYKMALRLDLLSVCDVLLVASRMSAEVKQEIEFANLVGMEVRYLEEEKH